MDLSAKSQLSVCKYLDRNKGNHIIVNWSKLKSSDIYEGLHLLNALRLFDFTVLPAAMRYILKAESDDRRGARRKLYCIIAGSAVLTMTPLIITYLNFV